jgi:hypothetical protein
MFAPSSRYAGLEVARHQPPGGGEEVPYVRRRLLPALDTLTVIGAHVVADEDRLDRVAAEHLADPERFWQVADANPVLDPAELTARPGRVLDIALPAATAGGARGF